MRSKTGLAVFSATLLLGFASPALAITSPTTCSPTKVAWDPSAGGSFNVFCGGNWFAAWVDGTVYAHNASLSVPLDILKVWSSLAEAAILSGKKLEIAFTVSNGFNVITWLELDQ
jgi:hypothetical protein